MAHFDDTKLKAYFRAELAVLYSLATLFFAVVFVTGWESVEAVEGIAVVLVVFGAAWLGMSVWCVVRGAEKMAEPVRTMHTYGKARTARVVRKAPIPAVIWPFVRVRVLPDTGEGPTHDTWCFGLPSEIRRLRIGEETDIVDAWEAADDLQLAKWFTATLPHWQEAQNDVKRR